MEFPFEIPKAMEKDILADIAEANPPWCDLENWEDSDGDPVIFGYCYCWCSRTRYLVTNLKRMLASEPRRVESPDEHEAWEAINGVLHALELRLSQFEGLLAWGRASWSYDPNIREKFKTSPGEDHEVASDTEKLPGQDAPRTVLLMKGGAA